MFLWVGLPHNLAPHSDAPEAPRHLQVPCSARLEAGNPGDAKPVGEGVSELRIAYGPGYRVYFTRQGRDVVVLLAGGDKRTQSADIRTAQRLARNL
jgi:putative addiction module killer protein